MSQSCSDVSCLHQLSILPVRLASCTLQCMILKKDTKMAEVIDFGNIIREDLTNYSGASNLKFNEKIKSLKASGKEIYHFGFGQSPFPVPAPFVKQLQVKLRLTS